MKNGLKLILFLVVWAAYAHAQIDSYRYRAPLEQISGTWHSLHIPSLVYEKSQNGLADLRIYGIKGKDTIEVPYILEKNADQLIEREIDFQIINQSSKDKQFYYTFKSAGKDIINQIKLAFEQTNFDWEVNLDGSDNNQEWFSLLKSYRILSIRNKRTSYHFTDLNFPDSKYAYYRISISANEQPKLRAAKIVRMERLPGMENNIHYSDYRLTNDQKLKETVMLINLPAIAPVSYLRLNIDTKLDFYRPIKIECATDSIMTEKGINYLYTKLFEGSLSILERPEFRFNAQLAKHLRITIQNDDNRPLNIKSFDVKGPVFELIARFEHLDYQYSLYFGNKEATAPVYDLKIFESKIPLSINSLKIGKATANPTYQTTVTKPLFERKAWLWAIMGIIISLLGFFAYKMLREK
ncbi:MAG: hypothetical protein REI78_10250 [Pedobacter sp.]|nr:hypothetical protein [Pedobacter sp.]MDQ8053398.1 hypothetical protein [Pedobacter sp.]